MGINPKGAVKEGHSIDGALPEEMRRAGSFQWPPAYTNYAWGALQGAVVQAEILYQAGYDAWQWEDQALLRAVEFHYGLGWKPSGDDQWIPHLIDARYGTHFADNLSAGPGKIMGWTAWTHQSGSASATSLTGTTSSLTGTMSSLTGTTSAATDSGTLAYYSDPASTDPVEKSSDSLLLTETDPLLSTSLSSETSQGSYTDAAIESFRDESLLGDALESGVLADKTDLDASLLQLDDGLLTDLAGDLAVL